jgi:NAD(P)-dependent dehydrogenase (short-subunit alcohol dehydrogenase family)
VPPSRSAPGKREEVDASVKELKARGRVIGAPLDVNDAKAYRAWIDSMAAELGGLDLFVHNVSAGGGMEGETSWYKCFELDVMGAVRGSKLRCRISRRRAVARSC